MIDSKSETDFDTKLNALGEIWDEREKSASEPEFMKYIKSHLARDLKEKMILPVRRNAGLKYEFFYDNATGSINHQLKVHIRGKKVSVNVQGSRHINCTLAEASGIYYGIQYNTIRYESLYLNTIRLNAEQVLMWSCNYNYNSILSILQL